jgi:hypothetical protein
MKEGKKERRQKGREMEKGRPQRFSTMQQNMHRNTKEGKRNARRRKVGRDKTGKGKGKGKGRIE